MLLGNKMNTVTLISKSPRLTEIEVHEAAQSLIDENQVVSSLSLLRILGRGSLTTITKHMSSFNKTIESLNTLADAKLESINNDRDLVRRIEDDIIVAKKRIGIIVPAAITNNVCRIIPCNCNYFVPGKQRVFPKIYAVLIFSDFHAFKNK